MMGLNTMQIQLEIQQQEFLDSMEIPCLGLNKNQQMVYFNPSFSNWLGQDSEQLRNQKIQSFIDLGTEFRLEDGPVWQGHCLLADLCCLPLQMIQVSKTEDLNYYQILKYPRPTKRPLLEEPPFFELTQEISGTGLWSWTVGAEHVIWSAQTYQIFRVPPDEAIDFASYMSLIHPDDRALIQAAVEKTLSGQEKHLNIEHRLLLRDDSIRYVTCLGQVLHPPNQAPQLLGVIRDLTDQRLIEADLKARENQLQTIFEHSHVGILLLDSQGFIQEANPYACQILLSNEPNLNNIQFQDLLHPDDLQAINAPLSDLFNGHKKAFRVEAQLAAPEKTNQQTLWVDISLSQIQRQGKRSIVVILTDITPQRHYQQALVKSEERLSLAFKGANDGLWDWNLENDHIYFSPRWKSMLGYREDELEHHLDTFNTLIHPEDKDNAFVEIDKFLSGESKAFEVEFRLKHRQGHYVNVLSRAFLVRDPNTQIPLRMAGTHVDLSDLKLKEKALQQAKEEAELANASKNLFLANMSHELRTPLNAVLGFSKWLKQQPHSEPKEKLFLERIHANAMHLLHLINDLLDISKLESGHTEIDLRSISLNSFIHELMESSRLLIEKNDNRLELKLEAETEEFTTDPLRLKQILLNLLSNAAKFTQQGRISIRIFKCHNNTLCFAIQDTGIGIKEEFIPKLFKSFSQASSEFNREYGGTGLGLAISYKLAQILGGNILVTSSPGKGSTFTLELPLK